MDERKRENIVAFLRGRMAEFGIKPGDIATSIAADQARLRRVRFHDASAKHGMANVPCRNWELKRPVQSGPLSTLQLIGLRTGTRENAPAPTDAMTRLALIKTKTVSD